MTILTGTYRRVAFEPHTLKSVNTWTADIVEAFKRIGGIGPYQQIYDSVRAVRPRPLPRSWKQVVQRRIQDLSSDSAGFKNGEDLFFSVDGLGSGVWGLRDFVVESPTAVDLSPGEENPGRVPQQTYRILRDTKLARQLKLLHQDQCQICGIALEAGRHGTYAEAHHIIPLGSGHKGPDHATNILVLCPNHHAQCDMGAIRLDLSSIRQAAGHTISTESIEYHNTQIYTEPFASVDPA